MTKTEKRNKFLIFLIALFFAVVFWIFVMADANPTRVKDVKNVAIQVRGSQALADKGLVVRTKSKDTCTVRLEGPANSLTSASSDWLDAYIDVSKIESAGEYKATVQVINMANASAIVKSVNPVELTVEVDEYMEKDVPIEVQFEGTIPDDYWFSDITVEPERAHISGAKQDITPISKGVCKVSTEAVISAYEQSGNKGTYSANINVEFVDENGNKVDYDQKQNAIVSMQVAKKKKVPIDFTNGYTGSVAKGYKVNGVTGNYNTVEIVGTQEVLDKIGSIGVAPITLNGERSQVVKTTTFVSPAEGVAVLGDGTVVLTIEIVPEE